MHHEVFGVRFDDVSRENLTACLRIWLNEGDAHTVVTPNPEFLLEARGNAAFRELLNGSDLVLPDGVGIRYAVAALSDRTLTHRHTGADVLELLATLCAEQGKTLLLFGGLPGSAQSAADVFRRRSPRLRVIAFDPGQIDPSRLSSDLLQKLREAHPDVLAVALGQGKQERFIREVAPHLPSLRIAIGVGGALDMLSGKRPRAPRWLRATGLEWLWRLIIEPKRARRIARAVFLFPAVVACATLKRRRFLHACRRVFAEVFDQLFRS